jgi:hypothetical protein
MTSFSNERLFTAPPDVHISKCGIAIGDERTDLLHQRSDFDPKFLYRRSVLEAKCTLILSLVQATDDDRRDYLSLLVIGHQHYHMRCDFLGTVGMDGGREGRKCHITWR